MNQQQENIIIEIKEHTERLGGLQALYKYIDKVYLFLNKLPAGEIITVSDLAIPENISLYTAVVKLYICQVHNVNIRFLTNDFTQFRKFAPKKPIVKSIQLAHYHKQLETPIK